MGAGQSVLSLVLLLASIDQFQRAEKVARDFGNYCNLDQTNAINELLEGSKNCEDKEKAFVSITKIVLTHLKESSFSFLDSFD